MRRDQLEVGVRYRSVDDKCYEIVDLTPGWRIGFTEDWVRDDSTRLRVRNGHTIAFRNNNALRAFVWDGETATKAVITAQRLLQRWDLYTRMQDAYAEVSEEGQKALDTMAAIVKGSGYTPGSYSLHENRVSAVVPLADLKVLLAFAEMEYQGYTEYER